MKLCDSAGPQIICGAIELSPEHWQYWSWNGNSFALNIKGNKNKTWVFYINKSHFFLHSTSLTALRSDKTLRMVLQDGIYWQRGAVSWLASFLLSKSDVFFFPRWDSQIHFHLQPKKNLKLIQKIVTSGSYALITVISQFLTHQRTHFSPHIQGEGECLWPRVMLLTRI